MCVHSLSASVFLVQIKQYGANLLTGHNSNDNTAFFSKHSYLWGWYVDGIDPYEMKASLHGLTNYLTCS